MIFHEIQFQFIVYSVHIVHPKQVGISPNLFIKKLLRFLSNFLDYRQIFIVLIIGSRKITVNCNLGGERKNM